MRISSKLKPLRALDLYKISAIKGSNITAYSPSTNHRINRNSSCFRKYNPMFDLDPNPEDVSVSSGSTQVHAPTETKTLVDSPVATTENLIGENVRCSTRAKFSVERLQVKPSRKTYV